LIYTPIIVACDQLKENNYNDFIELEPRDNGLIVQQDMTNDDTNFEVIVAVNHLCSLDAFIISE
jgi:hypothetical protein